MTTTAQLHSGSDPDPDPDSYKQAFRRYPAGVVVITLDSGVGPVGFTATSLSPRGYRHPVGPASTSDLPRRPLRLRRPAPAAGH